MTLSRLPDALEDGLATTLLRAVLMKLLAFDNPLKVELSGSTKDHEDARK